MHTKLNHEVDGVGMAVASRRAVVSGRRASSGRARGDVGEQWRAGPRRRARGASADGAAKGLTDGGRDRGGIRMRPGGWLGGGSGKPCGRRRRTEAGGGGAWSAGGGGADLQREGGGLDARDFGRALVTRARVSGPDGRE
jgi:hypothetical protein